MFYRRPLKGQPMPSGKKRDAIEKSFLKELSRTLDLTKTVERLGITEDEARGLFSSIQKRLFGPTPPTPPKPPKSAEQRPPEQKSFTEAADRTFSIYVDGASRGNPGLAGAGAVIKDGEGNVIKRIKRSLGITTNNIAEYRALILGLKGAKRLGLSRVKIFADSELVVKQLKGEYRVKNEGLKPLHSEARDLARGFEGFTITYISRDKNAEADRLANKAIDHGEEHPVMV